MPAVQSGVSQDGAQFSLTSAAGKHHQDAVLFVFVFVEATHPWCMPVF